MICIEKKMNRRENGDIFHFLLGNFMGVPFYLREEVLIHDIVKRPKFHLKGLAEGSYFSGNRVYFS